MSQRIGQTHSIRIIFVWDKWIKYYSAVTITLSVSECSTQMSNLLSYQPKFVQTIKQEERYINSFIFTRTYLILNHDILIFFIYLNSDSETDKHRCSINVMDYLLINHIVLNHSLHSSLIKFDHLILNVASSRTVILLYTHLTLLLPHKNK